MFCAVAFSNAGASSLLVVLAVYIAAFWMLVWAIRLVWFLIRGRAMAPVKVHGRRLWLPWVAEPLALMLGALLAWLGVFGAVRFAISLPALNAYAAAVRAGQVDLHFEWYHAPRRVGCYVITYTNLLDDGSVRFITGRDGLFDQAGFAQSLRGAPQGYGGDSYRPIADHWWVWREHW